jgi:hypothetical protein
MACLFDDLVGVDDVVLVRELERLCQADRALSAELIVHLGEVLERRLFLGLGFSSMFDYCRVGLEMSEAEAYLRIYAAKVGRRFPLVLERLGGGELHLTAIKLLGPHLTVENHVFLLDRVRGLSKRKIEMLVAELAPKADVPARVTRLPVARANSTALSAPSACSAALFPDAVQASVVAGAEVNVVPLLAAGFAPVATLVPATTHALVPTLGPAPTSALAPALSPASSRPAPAACSTPLGPGRFKVVATLDQSEHDALSQLQELLRHQNATGDIARIIGRALKELCAREMKRRFAQGVPARRARVEGAPLRELDSAAPDAVSVEGSSPSSQRDSREVLREVDEPVDGPCVDDLQLAAEASLAQGPDSGSQRSRYIPRQVLREVYKRDGGQCSFVSDDGRRCSAREFIEVHHHDTTFARGGEATAENLRLVCRAHNLFFAERDYGSGFMSQKVAGRARSSSAL